ncbi:MAG: ribulokinase [Lentisphaeria bacterium]|nr:ribulokinase [Lentisphaeria bacterium]
MDDKFLIGLDFGSDSVRAVLVNTKGEQLATSVHNYTRWAAGKYSDAAVSRFRQHPLDYLEGTEKVIRDVVCGIDPAQIAGIGVDTTGSTPCAVDAEGCPLALKPEFAENPNAMFILWKDHTALEESQRINDVAKTWGGTDYTMYEGGSYSPEWYWSKLLYVLRHDEAVRNAIHGFVEHCDWITAELAGTSVKPSRCAAGHKALWHESWGGMPPEEFFAAVDPLLIPIRRKMYSETFTADVPVGHLSAKWAEKLGLTTNVVIAGGAIDCHVGAVGAGIRANQIVKVIGTSTCDLAVAPEVTKCVPGICGQVDGSIVPGLTGMEAGQSAFGDIYAWFKRFVSIGGKVELSDLEKEAAALPDGDVMALDWMNGRRTPDANPFLKGAIFGINLGTTPAMVYRALVESTAFGSRAIAERFLREGIKIEGITAIGGIAKKSPFVMQYLADALNMPIKVAAYEQTCALGAAMFAAVASGIYADIYAAMDAMAPETDMVYTPKRNLDERYAQYLRYAGAYEQEVMKQQ